MVVDKRRDWLAELTVGSLVIVESRYGRGTAKVVRITPSGRIAAGSWQFDASGREIGGSAGFGTKYLMPATPETIAEIKASSARRKVRVALKAMMESDAVTLDAFIATLTDEQREMLEATS